VARARRHPRTGTSARSAAEADGVSNLFGRLGAEQKTRHHVGAFCPRPDAANPGRFGSFAPTSSARGDAWPGTASSIGNSRRRRSRASPARPRTIFFFGSSNYRSGQKTEPQTVATRELTAAHQHEYHIHHTGDSDRY
jgi:hypothetical protein